MRPTLLLLVLACQGGEDTTTTTDTDVDTAVEDTSADTGDFCDGVPAVNYNNFGRGFMTESCQGCHASTTANRYGAPEGITFDTVEQVWGWSSYILQIATGEGATMPPAGGVSEDDRTRLSWWLRCAPEGT